VSDPRPPVRRVGRRRVVTDEAPGVLPREDSTPGADAAFSGEAVVGAGEIRAGDAGSAGADGTAEVVAGPAEPARDRWLRDQRPPHWA